MKKKAINLAQTPIAMKRVLFAFLFFSVWATPNVGADPSLSGEKELETQVLQDGRQIAITGTVVDKANEPLIGVSVKVAGTSIGTATDFDGKFSINVPRVGSVLEFTYVGYTSQKVTVGSNTTISVVMEDDSQVLGTVVVTAPIGVQRPPKEIGYSVSSISAKQLTEAGNTNFASAMYGKAAGVKINAAPGGATSAVNIQIRGVNSLNYNSQPLYVVDGIMIRNDNQNAGKGTNNDGYWGDQRIRGNGALDINPMDIESMTILKGASASALYGSDAASGVVVITTKKGSRGEGLGVEFNYNGAFESVAFLPQYQEIYGPGYGPANNFQNGNIDGWLTDGPSDINGGLRPRFSAWAQFGPKYDGRQVAWWDGTNRSYSSQGSNNLRDVFQVGFSSNLNVALSKQTDKVNYRLSYTRLDYTGTQRGSEMQKNTFNLNSVVNVAKDVSLDVVANFMNTNTHNRPESMDRIFNNYSGMINRAESIDNILDRFKTSRGYKYTSFGNRENRPGEEYFRYNTNATTLMDYFWNRLRNNYDETENRLITSATMNWDILGNSKLKFRGRIGNDYTGINIEDERFTEQASAFNTTESTGQYAVTKSQYSILYGDALLSYSDKLSEDFGFTIAGGMQGRQEEYKTQYSGTTKGLVTENWFSLKNSFGIVDATSSRAQLLKYAYLGILNLSYKDMLFLEATARQEYASTLPPNNNSYFYTSTNGSWIFTEAFQTPSWLTYGKVRASYGVVGNSPVMYVANIAYDQKSLQTLGNGSVAQLTMNNVYGNMDLTAEMKHEWEFGLETRFWDDRASVDISYYTNKVKDQFLEVTAPYSSGGGSQIMNVGEISSQGLEIAGSLTPIIGDFRWTTRLNWSFNKSKVNSLKDGVSQIEFWSEDQASVKIAATVGEKLGNIYVFPRKTNDKGELLISDDGYYIMDDSKYEKVGNVLPDVVGGWSNTLNYKNFSLDFTIDYRFGGKIISPGTKYATSAGLLKSTLPYRDAGSGGLPWVFNAKDDKGNVVGTFDRNDGVLLDGVNVNTGEKNTTVISAADYYMNTFYWGKDAWNEKGMVYDNDYIKFREITLGYLVPDTYAKKLFMSNLRVSLFARNLFYIYKTADDIDPEASIGSKWYSQGIDSGASMASRTFGFMLSAKF
ncbi:SusC/RagA family TonB-linked outer membrane protein [Dysgonomonas sp. GY617]|uniref:SusC/RagA family TonB-linked outer membrane protein n=1 Tax=Dysgonomonas sp. GY617 TaxID=2780420 RepID=UPI001884428E|nr:SusC/RagA family TonB-linked outer membrane protein [Dysgonomonas sp. GY617]MBF0576834.1 SusC/RagA family TonB-linked outer membrane protein [Dysgonomonas sp. GY617]